MSAENAPTHAAMMTPGEEVERDITLVADLDAFIGQPERAIAARMWPCECLDALQK